jgi:hypothetical protein
MTETKARTAPEFFANIGAWPALRDIMSRPPAAAVTQKGDSWFNAATSALLIFGLCMGAGSSSLINSKQAWESRTGDVILRFITWFSGPEGPQAH